VAASIVHSHVDGVYAQSHARLDEALAEDAPASVLLELLDSPPWSPSAEDDHRLRSAAKSEPAVANAVEYAAWTLTHGHRLNHMTIFANTLGLANIKGLADLNALLQAEGMEFNPAGGNDGVTQGSLEVGLQQSSTRADLIEHTFSCGTTQKIPCAFLELIERHDGFSGFLGQNAKGIFSSTHQR